MATGAPADGPRGRARGVRGNGGGRDGDTRRGTDLRTGDAGDAGRRALHDPRPGPLPRRAGAEGDVSGRVAAGRRLRAARPGSARPPGPRHRLQPAPRVADRLAPRRPHRARLHGPHAAREAGQRRRAVRPQRRQDRARRRLGRSRPQRARRQAVDPRLGRSAEADPRARGGGSPQAGGLRHHDRALRGLERAAARAGHGCRGVRRDGPGHAGRARRLHRERAPPDEGRLGRAQHPSHLVLRRHAAGRGLQRHRHAPGRPRAVDAVARSRRRRQGRRQGARRLSLADDDPGGRLPPRHRHGRLPRRPEGAGQGRLARVLLQHVRDLHAARRAHVAERDLGLGSAGWRRRHALRRLSRNEGARRSPADQGGRLQARGLHRAQPGGAMRRRSSPRPGAASPPSPPSGRASAPR